MAGRSFNEVPITARLNEAERALAEAHEQQAATAAILKVISSSPSDVQPVFDAIVGSAQRLIGSFAASVTQVVGDTIHLGAYSTTAEPGNQLLQAIYPLSFADESSPTVMAIRSRAPFQVSDIETDPSVQQRERELGRARGYRAVMAVPLMSGDKAIGTINVSRREPGAFTHRVIGLIETFADEAVIAIQNARLFEELQEKRRIEERQTEELADWSRTLERRVEEQVAQVEQLGRLKRFFSPQLAELIVAGGARDPLRTHRRQVTVVFLDLRGFTLFAETVGPEELMGVLREYHAAMGELIVRHEGTLERFTGDGMMIFFNDPVEVPDHAERAVRMALDMRDRVAVLVSKWKKKGWDLALGIGIAQGDATIGAIGFEGRWDYGAIGTVTNLAARLCGEAKGGQILLSAGTATAVRELVEMQEVGTLTLKGMQNSVQAINVIGPKSRPA